MKSFYKRRLFFGYSKYFKGNPPIVMDRDLDVSASEIFYLIKARNCAVACARYVLIDE